MKTVDHELVQLALDRVDGDRFELFAQAFMAAMLGSEFMPLGGKKDGGADGAVQAGLYEGKSNFMQASIQEDYRRKIRDTVGRLHEVGREPASLIYCTSRTVPLLDKEAQTLSNELGVSVQIRDQRYIISQINAAPQTVQAFETYLKPHLAFLNQIGGATLVEASLTREIPARALCVFLGQEVDRRRGNTQLLEAVTDSLILWALEETDPAKEVFMTRDEMLAKIEETLPNAVAFVRGTIDNRLAILSSKGGANGREIRHHKKGNKFCLAFETRRLVYQQNAEDETLKAQVTTLFIDRAAQVGGANIAEVVAEVCHRALNITFERQGLEVAAFLDASRTDEVERITISDNIDLALEQMRVPIAERGGIKSAAMLVLRKTFYESSEVERRYLVKLSRTYALLFTLKSEPRVVEYFRGMSSNFVLYVGSDLIVRALSERFLNPDDQMTHNLFKILKAAGSELILTEAALTELLTHLQAQDLEFTNNYQSVERELSLDFVRHIGRLLIRAYFYARLDPEPGQERPRDWPSFIEQFSSYPDLHKAGGRDSLRRTSSKSLTSLSSTMRKLIGGWTMRS